jgi:F-type H+-transporting ATPase subunit b
MPFDWSTFALQTINFAILVWLLHRFLYKPVLRMVDARRAEMDKQYAEVRAAEAEAQDRLAEIESERAGIVAERSAALKQVAAEAEQAAVARLAQAERDAASLLDDARKTLAAEREQALLEARRAALDLGAEIAGRLLAHIPTPLRAEAWLDRIEKHLATIPPAEKEKLIRQLVNGGRIEVVTASVLPAEAAELWRSRLQNSLGDRVAIDFGVEPKLVAGAELHFPNAILRFSWQDALASMRADIKRDGDAR